jgi:hypothetical protein
LSTKPKNLQRFEKTNNNIENNNYSAKVGQEEEEPFVTLLNDGRIEVEEIEVKFKKKNFKFIFRLKSHEIISVECFRLLLLNQPILLCL